MLRRELSVAQLRDDSRELREKALTARIFGWIGIGAAAIGFGFCATEVATDSTPDETMLQVTAAVVGAVGAAAGFGLSQAGRWDSQADMYEAAAIQTRVIVLEEGEQTVRAIERVAEYYRIPDPNDLPELPGTGYL